jgi:putative peptidoglycan lipid II flippase
MGEKLFRVLHRTWGNLHEAALLMAVFALLSQVLALFRDRLLASHFGAGEALDVYYAAFRIPDIIFVSVASLAAVTVLVPFLFQKLEEDPTRKAARRFMDDVFTTFLVVLVLTIILAAIFVPYVTHWIVPGFSSEAQEEFVLLTRILLLSPLLFGVSNLLGTITQSFGRFFVFALGPVLYNIGIISGIVIAEPIWGIRGVAYGVIMGACAHMLIQIPVVYREGLLPRLTLRPRLREIRRVVVTSLPRTLALASAQIAATILVGLASIMEKGSIAVFTLALNLQSIPLAIVGVSYSVAAFPALAKLFTKGEHDEFLKEITTAARHIVFWSLPATVLFVVLRAQVVRTAFGAGQFDWTATRLVAAALALFAISVVAQSLMLLLVYQGRRETDNYKKRTPAYFKKS